MMIIRSAFLTELLDHIRENRVAQAILSWRTSMETQSTQCETCTYEHMLGRRCCCMCLESALDNTALRQPLERVEENPIKTVTIAVKAHRLENCASCLSKKD